MYSAPPIVGYFHVIIESLKADETNAPIYAHISIGELSKTDSTPKPSGSLFNETFLLEVPKDPSRLAIICYEGEKKIGECRYDINPFF